MNFHFPYPVRKFTIPRWGRISIRIVIGILAVIVLLWGSLAIYIHYHKKELLQKLTTTLGNRVQGRLAIRDAEPSLWRSFPNVEVSLKDVTLRDSLWEQHHHSLLDVHNLYVKLNLFALFSHRVEIMKLTAANGSVFLYADSTGYRNTYLLDRRDTTKKNRTALLERFGVEDVHFYFVSDEKNKDFHLYISSMNGVSSESSGIIHSDVTGNIHVYSFAFSTLRGSFLRNQDLHINGRFDYHKNDKILDIVRQQVGISGETISMDGKFYFHQTPSAFELHMSADAIADKSAKAWVSPNILKVITPFVFAKPIGVKADVSGIMKYRTIPLIRLVFTIKDNVLNTPLGSIDNFSGVGQYYNESIPGAGHGDDNSELRFTAYSGSWRNLPFNGDTLLVRNLLVPYVNAHIISQFPLPALGNIMGNETFALERGAASADLHYQGGVMPDDPTPYSLNGFISVKDAAVTYVPRNLAFSDVGARILFKDDNLFLRDVTLRTKGSSVRMEGEALHFFRLYFSDPGKIQLAWRANSPQVDLNEFLAFAGRRRATQRTVNRTSGPVARIGSQLDRVLAESSIAIDARVDRLLYKHFVASSVVARASLAQNEILLQQAGLSHAGGSLIIAGVIHQQQAQNPFQLKAILNNVDVATTFLSFNNFGQGAISNNNLKGKLTATANITGGMTEDGRVIKNSLHGNVGFKLEDGELNNFPPLAKISKYVFKKRNLDHIMFKDLKGNMDIDGPKITIHPLDIQSSAINIQVAGIYSLTTGTDIAIQVPLRNPSKEKGKSPIGKLLRATGKGIVVHLRATDGDQNGVKIGWDPLRKGKAALPDSLKLD